MYNKLKSSTLNFFGLNYSFSIKCKNFNMKNQLPSMYHSIYRNKYNKKYGFIRLRGLHWWCNSQARHPSHHGGSSPWPNHRWWCGGAGWLLLKQMMSLSCLSQASLSPECSVPSFSHYHFVPWNRDPTALVILVTFRPFCWCLFYFYVWLAINLCHAQNRIRSST